jgi:putative ABC transport system substrate-binding protein
VDKILKERRPTEIPIEEPTRFELTIDMKTAEALGISLPPMVLARADRIVE